MLTRKQTVTKMWRKSNWNSRAGAAQALLKVGGLDPMFLEPRNEEAMHNKPETYDDSQSPWAVLALAAVGATLLGTWLLAFTAHFVQ